MTSVTTNELQGAWLRVKRMGTSLPEAPNPKLPVFTNKTPMKTRLLGIQNYINTIEYNYTGTLYFDINKNRSFKSIVLTAKEITTEMLPIQCLEAVFLAAFLTANVPDLERFPISFKSQAGGTVHRHIILAVRHQQNKWGALGLSRSEKLMYKELRYHSLSELIQDYCHGFSSLSHQVTTIHIGFPFPHDIHSGERVEWRVLNLPLNSETNDTSITRESRWNEVATHLDTFAKEALDIQAFKRTKGTLPDSFLTKYPLHTPEKEVGKKSPERRVLGMSGSEVLEGITREIETTVPSIEKQIVVPEVPIKVTPEQLVLKRMEGNITQDPPSNIFVQNTTAFAYTVEIEDPTGQLEVVTKVTPPTQEGGGDVKPSKPTFRVSARGMIVIAMKLKPVSTEPVAPTTTVQTTARKPELRKARTPRGSLVPRGVPMEKVTPLKNEVIFRCIRVSTKSTGEDNNAMENDGSDSTFVTQLPFTIGT